MPEYKFTAINKEGETFTSFENAENKDDLIYKLKLNGLFLLDYKIKNQGILINRINALREYFFPRKITDENIAMLFGELSVLLKSGIRISNALSFFLKNRKEDRYRELVFFLLQNIKSGKSFSDSLKNLEKYYNFKDFLPMIKAGEKSGTLGESLEIISENISEKIKIKSSIGQALIYPSLLFFISLVAIFIILVFVIPRFQPIVESFKVDLSFSGKIVFGLSRFLENNYDFILSFFILLLLFFLFYLRNEGRRKKILNIFYNFPLIRRYKTDIDSISFFTSFQYLLSGGVPLVESLNLSIGNFSQKKIRILMFEVLEAVRKGESLADSISKIGLFPPIVGELIHAGEKTGKIAEMINEIKKQLIDKQIKKIKKFMALVEPVIIIIVGVIIGGIILIIVPAIMSISEVNF